MSVQRPVALFLLVLPLAGVLGACLAARSLWEQAIGHTVTVETSQALLDVRAALQDVVIPALILFTVLAAVNALFSIRRGVHTNAA